MINKLICILLLILYILLIYLVYKEINKYKYSNVESFQLYTTDTKTNNNSIEHFQSNVNEWTSTPEEINLSKTGLNKIQKEEINDLINAKINKGINEKLNSHIANNNKHSPGERGPMGPAGGEYIASGLLINKEYGTENGQIINMSASRSHGEGDSGKAYLELKDMFSPASYWYFSKEGQIKNRYDNYCLTTNGNLETDLYMSTCKDDDPNQLWEWNNKSNRLVLQNSSKSNSEKCISLTGRKMDANTKLAGCSNSNGICSNGDKRFLKLKECNQIIKNDEIWSFN